jgi:hypothetical protein
VFPDLSGGFVHENQGLGRPVRSSPVAANARRFIRPDYLGRQSGSVDCLVFVSFPRHSGCWPAVSSRFTQQQFCQARILKLAGRYGSPSGFDHHLLAIVGRMLADWLSSTVLAGLG